MFIQFGYVTLFSSAYPLAGLCALLNNIIEIRGDAFKLCFVHKRPFGARVNSIGSWQVIILWFDIHVYFISYRVNQKCCPNGNCSGVSGGSPDISVKSLANPDKIFKKMQKEIFLKILS